MSYKPVRVCLTCFDELTKGKQPALHGPSGGAQKTSPVAEAPNSQDTSGEDSDSDDDATENVAPPVNNEARFFGDETPASAENTQPKAAENDDPVAAAVAAAVAECNQTGAAVAEGNKTEAVVAEGNTTEASVAPGDVMEVAGGDAKTEANCAEPPA
ncbi:PREDICTED: uncharacterized protein LOC106813186 [Priapulus caudatus]|uniref:Uncharacterized protein LOC106813186 n=1 Tax=Priapulus caudatus TaxID=37621 RepID=A0ABM1EKL8_PRICU|nr:PREDICTED: uncharacterized protein LOC106813186 [Priapulus caudatus]